MKCSLKKACVKRKACTRVCYTKWSWNEQFLLIRSKCYNKRRCSIRNFEFLNVCNFEISNIRNTRVFEIFNVSNPTNSKFWTFGTLKCWIIETLKVWIYFKIFVTSRLHNFWNIWIFEYLKFWLFGSHGRPRSSIDKSEMFETRNLVYQIVILSA